MRIDINAAVEFAARAHEGQVRKYNGAPYIIHPVEVMNICRYAGRIDDSEVLAAAVLHDTVEDCDVTVAEIADLFGERVAEMVDELTDQYVSGAVVATGMNRAQRKTMERVRQAAMSTEAQTIKLADMIANTHDIVAFDPGFARVYLAEKEALLNVLTLGSFPLREVASRSLEAGWQTVGRS